MADISALKSKLATLESKLKKLQSGEISAEYLPGEADQQTRQKEAVSRTELFIRQVKEAIAQEESKAKKK